MASDNEASTPAPSSSPAVKPKKPAAKKPVKAGKKAPAKKPVKAGKKAPAKKAVKPKVSGKAAKKSATKKAAKKVAKKANSHRGQGNAFITGPLYKMLKAKLPKKFVTKEGTINIKELAKATETSLEGIYRIFRINVISPDRAARVIKATASKIKGVDLLPFILPKV